MPYMKEKEIKKEKPVKKTRRGTKKKNKVDNSNLNLFVYNEESKLEIVKVPRQFTKNYITDFGVLTVRTKSELTNWLSNLQNQSI
jgi:hypothetical protein